MKKIIFLFFAILLFFVPLILWPFTSEVFEFNKIVLVYILTTLIGTCWIIRCITERKIIFNRTILDIPLLAFLAGQIISTFLSIDFYTSVFGYYSRFNGGLLSTICYIVLYWAFVSNFDYKETIKLIKIWLAVASIVALIGVGEHFKFFAVCLPIQYSQVHNINADPALIKKYTESDLSGKLNYLLRTSCWVQDVQSRVFATLGQPNWLAAWLVALIPLAWALAISNQFSKTKFTNFIVYLSLSILFFVTLLFTKSRSGLAGLIIADIIFWGFILIKKLKENLKIFIICHLAFSIVAIIIGTQFTPSLRELLHIPVKNPPVMAQGTVLENGGTESGTIRKIVWEGATKIWEHYPIFGTGPETYAYAYYGYRPIAHNTTSEWDFIYNKAHNEFLNFAANTGTVGVISYLIVIIYSIIQIFKLDNEILKLGLLAGYISLSVSNFFGFSVVPTQLEFFLLPAMAVGSWHLVENSQKNNHDNTNTAQKILIGCVLLATCYILLATYRYWHSDLLYSKAKTQNSSQRPDLAVPLLIDAIKNEKGQAIYYSEIASSYSMVAMAYDQIKDASSAGEFTNLAADQIERAVEISPANVNLHRQMFGVYVRLSTINEKYLAMARDSIIETLKLSPTDPKLFYNLGIADANLDETDKALVDFQKAIELKANYADARVQYAALLVHLNRISEAKEQLNYVLTKIDPGNSTARTALDNIK